ncbi:MAG: hypothetical protein KAG61_13900 [Bacteriovoracaceae bacterium]|nr:hypothetical protein [Bacteriovoracaceae bacterium]
MKLIIHWATLLMLVISIAGCSTVRLKYEADYKVAGVGQTNRMVYEKSYEVGNLRWWCALSGVFYGGACWLYLRMPVIDQEEQIRDEARKKLLADTQLSIVDIYNTSVKRVGWGFWNGEKEDFKNYGWSNEKVKPAPAKKSNAEEELDGFIQ